MSVGAAAIVLVIALVIEARNSVIEHQRAFARIELSEIGERLRRYYLDYGYYPTTEQGLGVMFSFAWDPWDLDPGILRSAPPPSSRKLLDPWGNPFRYESDGTCYVLKSVGPNGTEVGSDLTVKSVCP